MSRVAWGIDELYVIFFFMVSYDNKNQEDSISCFRKEYLEVVLSYGQKGCKEILNEEADCKFKY